MTDSPNPWWNPSRAKLAENRLSGRGDPEVSGQGQSETTADGRALDGDDHRQGPGHEGLGLVVEHAEPVGFGAGRPAEVEAGTEVAAFRAQHDGPRPVLVGPVHRSDHIGQQLGVEVVGRGPVHLHFGHPGGRHRPR